MLCDVVLLGDHGKRLRPLELRPPLRGMLRVEDSDLHDGGSLRRAARVARLYAYTGAENIHSHLLAPLFDPQVLRIGDTVITLIGIELSTLRPGGDDLRVC